MMGVGSSKPESQHVFTADTPIRFSQELVDSLQDSPESDTTRSKAQELAIQSRVTSELERLQSEVSSKLASLSEEISSEPDPSSTSHSLVEKIGDALHPGSAAERHRQQNMSHDSVSKEIEELKRKLERRKKLEQPDKGVEKAKEEVVQCLRMHDRRPLDCWKEMEHFKQEVGRLEREFVAKTVR